MFTTKSDQMSATAVQPRSVHNVPGIAFENMRHREKYLMPGALQDI